MKRGSTIPFRASRASSIQAKLFHWRRLFWLGVIVAVVTAGDVLLTKYGAALLAASVETGASFSVSAGSFPSEAKAATFAAALDSSGLPILVRVRPDDRRYQVLVGPYISTEEAERAQRRLAGWGLGEARLVVDDTMRSSPQVASVFGFGEGTRNSVIMAAAAGMSSIVFEMNSVPKEVEARRTSPTSLDVEVGHHAHPGGAAATSFDPLRLPDGVVLVRALSVQSDDPGSLRAHLVVPDGIESRLRLEGRRVYIDLAFPKAPWHVRKPTPGPKGPGLPDREHEMETQTETQTVTQTVGRVLSDPPDAYRAQLAAVVDRFTQIEPFLLSAVEQQPPEAEVFYALAHSLEGVRDSIEGLKAPAELENNRKSAIAAVARAKSSLAVDFVGDRAKTVREAVALFEGSVGPREPTEPIKP